MNNEDVFEKITAIVIAGLGIIFAAHFIYLIISTALTIN